MNKVSPSGIQTLLPRLYRQEALNIHPVTTNKPLKSSTIPSTIMPTLFKLLEQNRKWAEETSKNDPTYFPALAAQQTPDYLWIGCSDSRVP